MAVAAAEAVAGVAVVEADQAGDTEAVGTNRLSVAADMGVATGEVAKEVVTNGNTAAVGAAKEVTAAVAAMEEVAVVVDRGIIMASIRKTRIGIVM